MSHNQTTGKLCKTTNTKKRITVSDKTENIQQEYQQFVNVITHDFKNIFRSLKYLSEWIEEAIDKEDWDEVKNLRRMMVDKSTFGDDAINSLTKWAKIHEREVEISTFKFSELIEELCSELKIAPNTIHLTTQIIEIQSSRQIIKEILLELIDNSLTFNKSDTKKIKIQLLDNQDSYLITISDNGVLIRDAQIHDIFKVFYSSKKIQTTRHMGMGLPICTKLSQLLKGTLQLEKSSSNGSTFTIQLPK